jgi:hypothetical protein
MKKVIITIIVLLISTTCYAFNPLDKMEIPADKQLHILVSERLADYLHDEQQLSYFDSACVMLCVSAAKEYADSITGGKADITDIYANMSGWAINVFLNEAQVKFDW